MSESDNTPKEPQVSLAIDTDKVSQVLLADGWHLVANRSFDLDAYEYVWQDRCVHDGGQSDICATGFAFTDPDGYFTAGPLTSILAIRCSTR